jgi:hypothetical protein
MRTREDLESYFIQMGIDFEEVDEEMWVLKGQEGDVAIVCNYSPPVVVLQVKVMDLPDADDARLAGLYRRLLELNATDILHGSYGIEENEIVLSDALELQDLDFSELRSSYESLAFAATSHVPALAELVPAVHEG